MAKSTKWIDSILIVASFIVIGISTWYMVRSGVFSISLTADEKLSWHLVRSSGVVAYVLLLASTVWGIFISSQFVKDWSPGPVSMTLHTTISWLALILGMVHGLLLMFDNYFTYTLADIFVPFIGPYRPEVVGLGTLAFWMLVLISLSFPLKRFIGHNVWKRLHYTSYIAFGLVSVHGLMAGTDGHLLGFRILVGMGIVIVTVLAGTRIWRDRLPADTRPIPRKQLAER